MYDSLLEAASSMMEEVAIVDHGKEICLPAGMNDMGPVTRKLYDTLTGIQMGRIKGPEGWVVECR